MEKKVSFNMSKAASGLLEKAKNSAMNTFDQNNDGKLDREDVSAVSETIKSTARSVMDSVKTSASNSGRQLSERLEKAKRDSAFKTLHPIFEEDLESAEFYLSKLIRVAEMDKRHAESEICTNSIGHLSIEKELPVIHMYRNKIDAIQIDYTMVSLAKNTAVQADASVQNSEDRIQRQYLLVVPLHNRTKKVLTATPTP